MSKSQKIVIITGGAGNLGKAVVRKFLSLGYHIIVPIEPSVKIDQAFAEQSAALELIPLDLTNEHDVADFVQAVISKHSKIDCLMMLVGGFAMGNINETTLSDIDKMIRLNVFTAYAIAKPVFEIMKQQQYGHLIFIGARAGLHLKDGGYAVGYALAKSLIFRLSELFNAQGNLYGVKSSVVVPSIIDTEVNRASMPNANFEDWVKPESVAETLEFLCSDIGLQLSETTLKIYNRA